ncbi:Putative White collar 2 protein [Rhizopus microsporus]|nr:Putative White collar 2 protein [Rhizopus microsporus]
METAETDGNHDNQVMKLRMGSSFGEFTRRKNWSQSILDAIRDVVHVLSSDLHILYCSDASSEILGYKPDEIVGHLFTEFIHVDDVDNFVRNFRLTHEKMKIFRICYRFLRKDGKYATLETRGQFYKTSLFGNARRIPTEASQSIDSILDLKMENEMLKRKLAALKRQRQRKKSSNEERDLSIAQSLADDESGEDYSNDEMDMPAQSSLVYAQGVSPYHNISDSLSLFTGLRYDLGERSMGISMGLCSGDLTNVNESPTSIPFVENTEMQEENDEPRSKKQKRMSNRSEGVRICTDCGTTESPEWRKGPLGPKTLCNACGLRWSKRKRQEHQE